MNSVFVQVKCVVLQDSNFLQLVAVKMFEGSVFNNLSVLRPEARTSPDSARLLGWNVPADELHQIPEHWLKYEEPEASLHYLLGLIYIAFTFLSLTGNGLVIWVFSS